MLKTLLLSASLLALGALGGDAERQFATDVAEGRARLSELEQALAAAPGPRPNVIMIVADDLGWGDLSAYGGPVKTPNLDALARDGVRFTQAYASAYQCSPSRAGLLTGRYQQRFGHESNFAGPGEEPGGVGRAKGLAAYAAGERWRTGLGLPRSAPMLSEILKGLGYDTAIVGKWHLGFDPGLQPLDRGFDRFFGFWSGSSPYALRSTPDVIHAGRTGKAGEREDDEDNAGAGLPEARAELFTIRDQHRPAAEQSEYLTDLLGDRAVELIETQPRGRPFFLYLAHLAPHLPLTATRFDYARTSGIPDERRRIYYAMVLALDDNIGELRRALEKTGRDKDTLIVFVSDNGCPNPRAYCSNGALRERKQTLYEGGLRVPMIVAGPGVSPGRVVEAPVSLLDITPTVLSQATGKPAAVRRARFDGIDLSATLRGRGAPSADRAFYWRHQTNAAIRMGDWKLIRHTPAEGGRSVALYNLAMDPSELRDRKAAAPATAERLERNLEAWSRAMAPPRWVPANPKRRTFDGVTVDLY